MKRFACLLLVALLTIGLAACSGGATPASSAAPAAESTAAPASSAAASTETDTGDKPVIGFILGDLVNEFYIQMMEAGDQAAADYGVEISWQSCDASVEKEVALIENFIQQGVDCIVLDPMDAEGVVAAVNQATQAGIPVITCANKIEGEDNVCTLYTDKENVKKSTLAVCYALDGMGEIGLLSGNAGSWVVAQREDGFTEALEEFPDMTGDIQLTNLDPANATTITENWINTKPDLKGIVAISDQYVLASVTAAEGLGVKDDLIWASNDGNVENYDLIDEGVQLMDQLTGGYRVGYWNVAVAARILRGEDIPRDIYLNCHTIMSDETAAMLKDKGFETEYITTEEAKEIATNPGDEFGPDVPADEFVNLGNAG